MCHLRRVARGRPPPSRQFAREVVPAPTHDLSPQWPHRPRRHRVVQEHDSLTGRKHAAEPLDVLGRWLEESRRVWLAELEALHVVADDRVEFARAIGAEVISRAGNRDMPPLDSRKLIEGGQERLLLERVAAGDDEDAGLPAVLHLHRDSTHPDSRTARSPSSAASRKRSTSASPWAADRNQLCRGCTITPRSSMAALKARALTNSLSPGKLRFGICTGPVWQISTPELRARSSNSSRSRFPTRSIVATASSSRRAWIVATEAAIGTA